MTSFLPAILYLGSDPHFGEKLRTSVGNSDRMCDVIIADYSPGQIIEFLRNYKILTVYMDLDAGHISLEDVGREITLIKKYAPTRPTLFVALMGDDIWTEKCDSLITSGFQYLFYKNCDIDILLQDCAHLATGEDYPAKGFARCKGIEKSCTVNFISTITNINHDGFDIETDYLTSSHLIDVKIPIFPDLKNRPLTVLSRKDSAVKYPATYSYRVDFPMAGAWDEVSDELLSKDTIETWFANNKNDLLPACPGIVIVSQNFELLKTIFNTKTENSYQLLMTDNKLEDHTKECVLASSAQLIFIDLDDKIDDPLSIHKVSDFIDYLVIHHLNPFLVITNAKSTSEALQKTFEYTHLLATAEKLNSRILDPVISRFMVRKTSSSSENTMNVMSVTDVRRHTDILSTVTLIDISEHEVEFFSRTPIPYFTVVKFNLPLKFYAVVIPAYREKKVRQNEYHYVALINGISEENLRYLRKFINQNIFRPISDYSAGNLARIEQELLSEKYTRAEVPVLPVAIEEKPIEKQPTPFRSARQRLYGKTKL